LIAGELRDRKACPGSIDRCSFQRLDTVKVNGDGLVDRKRSSRLHRSEAFAVVVDFQTPSARVTPEDFGSGRGSYLEDFLRFEPGVFAQSAQGSEDTEVSVRGSGIQSDEIAGLELLD
jgi:hypothetical protein